MTKLSATILLLSLKSLHDCNEQSPSISTALLKTNKQTNPFHAFYTSNSMIKITK